MPTIKIVEPYGVTPVLDPVPIPVSDSISLFYLGRAQDNINKVWHDSPLANRFTGLASQSLIQYGEWLDGIVRAGRGDAYDLLVAIGLAFLSGDVYLAAYDATKQRSHVEIVRDKIIWLHEDLLV